MAGKRRPREEETYGGAIDDYLHLRDVLQKVYGCSLKKLKKKMKKMKILEIGPGDGTFMVHMVEMGIKGIKGIEPDPFLINPGVEHLVSKGRIEDLGEEHHGKYDLILSRGVLSPEGLTRENIVDLHKKLFADESFREHMSQYETDLKEILDKAAKLLKKRGIFAGVVDERETIKKYVPDGFELDKRFLRDHEYVAKKKL